MKFKSNQDVPKIIGELRQHLGEGRSPWEVDAQLSNNDPLTDPQRGGQREGETPEECRLAPWTQTFSLLLFVAVQNVRESTLEKPIFRSRRSIVSRSEAGNGMGEWILPAWWFASSGSSRDLAKPKSEMRKFDIAKRGYGN